MLINHLFISPCSGLFCTQCHVLGAVVESGIHFRAARFAETICLSLFKYGITELFSPPCVTYLISSSAAFECIIFGAKFSRFLCNFHDYPRRRGEKLKFFPSICIESSSKMRALIQITQHYFSFLFVFFLVRNARS